MPKTIEDKKAKQIYSFLEANVRPRFEKIIEEVNQYLRHKHNVEVGADFNWLMHQLTEEDFKNVKKD